MKLSKLRLRTSLSAILDTILPRKCVVCGRTLYSFEQHICLSCMFHLPETYFSNVEHNTMADLLNERIACEQYEPYARAAALFFYEASSPYNKITQALKYKRNISEGQYFASLLADRLAASVLYADLDLIIPVPLHYRRRMQRGYNQAEIIARAIASRLQIPCSNNILYRRRATATQTRLNLEGKRDNVREAFAVRPNSLSLKHTLSLDTALSFAEHPNHLSPKHILLVDDVFTSGSTTAECYKALRGVFPVSTRISVATLAFVHHE